MLLLYFQRPKQRHAGRTASPTCQQQTQSPGEVITHVGITSRSEECVKGNERTFSHSKKTKGHCDAQVLKQLGKVSFKKTLTRSNRIKSELSRGLKGSGTAIRTMQMRLSVRARQREEAADQATIVDKSENTGEM